VKGIAASMVYLLIAMLLQAPNNNSAAEWNRRPQRLTLGLPDHFGADANSIP